MNNIDFDAIDLTKEAPVTEPERQYYYIAKARKYVSEKAQDTRKSRMKRKQTSLSTTPVLSVKMRICVFTDVWDSLVQRRKRIRICSSDSADV